MNSVSRTNVGNTHDLLQLIAVDHTMRHNRTARIDRDQQAAESPGATRSGKRPERSMAIAVEPIGQCAQAGGYVGLKWAGSGHELAQVRRQRGELFRAARPRCIDRLAGVEAAAAAHHWNE
jgi:hypothetical protein